MLEVKVPSRGSLRSIVQMRPSPSCNAICSSILDTISSGFWAKAVNDRAKVANTSKIFFILVGDYSIREQI